MEYDLERMKFWCDVYRYSAPQWNYLAYDLDADNNVCQTWTDAMLISVEQYDEMKNTIAVMTEMVGWMENEYNGVCWDGDEMIGDASEFWKRVPVLALSDIYYANADNGCEMVAYLEEGHVYQWTLPAMIISRSLYGYMLSTIKWLDYVLSGYDIRMGK